MNLKNIKITKKNLSKIDSNVKMNKRYLLRLLKKSLNTRADSKKKQENEIPKSEIEVTKNNNLNKASLYLGLAIIILSFAFILHNLYNGKNEVGEEVFINLNSNYSPQSNTVINNIYNLVAYDLSSKDKPKKEVINSNQSPPTFYKSCNNSSCSNPLKEYSNKDLPPLKKYSNNSSELDPLDEPCHLSSENKDMSFLERPLDNPKELELFKIPNEDLINYRKGEDDRKIEEASSLDYFNYNSREGDKYQDYNPESYSEFNNLKPERVYTPVTVVLLPEEKKEISKELSSEDKELSFSTKDLQVELKKQLADSLIPFYKHFEELLEMKMREKEEVIRPVPLSLVSNDSDMLSKQQRIISHKIYQELKREIVTEIGILREEKQNLVEISNRELVDRPSGKNRSIIIEGNGKVEDDFKDFNSKSIRDYELQVSYINQKSNKNEGDILELEGEIIEIRNQLRCAKERITNLEDCLGEVLSRSNNSDS